MIPRQVQSTSRLLTHQVKTRNNVAAFRYISFACALTRELSTAKTFRSVQPLASSTRPLRGVLPSAKSLSFRTFTGDAATYRGDTTRSTSMKDPSHPSLYYHYIFEKQTDRPIFALSFLETPPLTAESPAVLGWLPAASEEASEGESGLNDFKENRGFIPLLHEAIKTGLLEDEIWKNGAIQAQSGWMHIFDQRNPPPLGRIPEPDDIIASIRVEDGEMLLDTYQPMPSYRVCTGDGVCQLTDTLMDHLLCALRHVVEKEKRGS